MKTVVSFLLYFLFCTFFVDAQEITNPPIKQAIPFSDRRKANLSGQIRLSGGRNRYIFTYGTGIYQKKNVFYAKAVGQSSGLANVIYRVKDSYESWFNMETTLPYKQVRDIREGHYTLYKRSHLQQKKQHGQFQPLGKTHRP